MARLETLARELETMTDRQDELRELITHVRDDSYDRHALFQELISAKLGFFAHKLQQGDYEYWDESDKPEEPMPQEQPYSTQQDPTSQEDAAVVDPGQSESSDQVDNPETPVDNEGDNKEPEVDNPVLETVPVEELPRCELCVAKEKEPNSEGEHQYNTADHPYAKPEELESYTL